MIRIKLISTPLLLAGVLVCLSACAPSLKLAVSENGAAGIAFSSNFSPLGASLIRRFTGVESGTTELFDRQAVAAGLRDAGISPETLSFPEDSGISFSGTVQEPETLPGNLFIRDRQNRAITMTISPESVNAFVDLLPPDTRDLLDLFMAPVFTGEILDREEYLEILAAAYGEKAAAEVASSVCTIHIRTPETVSSLRVDSSEHDMIHITKEGKTATAVLPLDILLTLRTPVTLTAAWR